jgi:hypothetical protein
LAVHPQKPPSSHKAKYKWKVEFIMSTVKVTSYNKTVIMDNSTPRAWSRIALGIMQDIAPRQMKQKELDDAAHYSRTEGKKYKEMRDILADKEDRRR